MTMLVQALVLAGTVYTGVRAYQQLKPLPKPSWRNLLRRRSAQLAPLNEKKPISQALEKAQQALVLSSASLGLATTGALLMNPLLSLASVPLSLYIFIPTYRTAYQTLVKQRQITNPVLDATRVTLCAVMGYHFIGALNAWLQAFSQQLSVDANEQFQQTLQDLFADEGAVLWHYVNGSELEVLRTETKAGDVIVVGVGEIIPADGIVLFGTAQVNQRIPLGEVEPLPIGIGERVLAAGVIHAGRLYIQLDQPPAPSLLTLIRTTMAQTPARKTHLQEIGEASANRVAPQALLAFVLTLPFLGVNHAAAFLCIGFGAHMRTLGPLAVQRFVSQAAGRGILIKDARALERGSLVNTLLLDSRLLADPATRAQVKLLIHTLRQRAWLAENFLPHRFAVYLLADGDDAQARQLVAELGLDDYFIATTPQLRGAVVERLQTAGRLICYVGQESDESAIADKATVTVALRGVANIQTASAQVLLLDNDLGRLTEFFILAAQFGTKQGFSLAAPIGLDVIDLATTLIFHFGLVYSVLFNYSGLLLSAFYARPIISRPAKDTETTPITHHLLAPPVPRSSHVRSTFV